MHKVLSNEVGGIVTLNSQYDHSITPLRDIAAVTPQWDQANSLAELMELKHQRTIAVVIPALNEEATIGAVLRSVRPLLGNLVDELWVMDSGSTDYTVHRALVGGAQVAMREEVLPEIVSRPGKGEVLWRSLGIVQSDIIAFMDADLIDPDPGFIPRLIGALLQDERLKLVKAYYRRPISTPIAGLEALSLESEEMRSGGGRLTELMVRPLLAALRPELTHIIQPLAGEYIAYRDHLMSIPSAPGYGVDIGILLDTVNLHGTASVGQVNLGVRQHRNRPIHELGVMGRQVVSALLSRCGITDSGAPLIQFMEENLHFSAQEHDILLEDRPPFHMIRQNKQAAHF